ncbi:acyl dehydratase [Sphingomonas sp. SRS2]|nr:acyl dehydratase [Sphingomonas sp. SRS2]
MTDPAQSDEWDAATSYQISDADIERAKLLLGVDTASAERQQNQTASYDNIFGFVHGVGNDNPLHRDRDYARSTRWGDIIAPGMMAGILNAPMRGDPIDSRIKEQTRGLFRGVHVFVSGGNWTWYRPIYAGDTIFMFSGDESQEVKPSEFSGRSVIRVRRDVKMNQRGEVVAVYRSLRVLTERKAARTRGKYSGIEAATYTADQIREIDEIYAAEKVRGREPRFFEDVQVGDQLGTMAKGPLTITDVVLFHAGGYGYAPYQPSVGRMSWKNRKRIPAFYVNNEQGIPDVAQRLHWDEKWARAIGNPMAYDYGLMRENYLYHFHTDWCGDDGIVVHFDDKVRKFNYIGDTQIITGEVVAKRTEEGRCLVDVVTRMTNQRGEVTVEATAIICLPSRSSGSALYPPVPVGLERRAVELMARHWELRR